MENIMLTETEESQLIRVFNLLNISHSDNDTERIFKAQDELLSMNNNILSSIKLMIKGLTITHIRQEEISLDLHKSLLIYLKNCLLLNQRYINSCDIYTYFCLLFDLILTVTNNENIQSGAMHLLFDNLMKTLIDNNNSMMEDQEYIDKLLQYLFDKIIKFENEHFLYVTVHGLELISYLILNKYVGPNKFFDFFKKYIVSTAEIIFNKVYLYIKPKNNEYDMDFVFILQRLYEIIYDCLIKMKRYYPSLKRKEIADEFFLKYGKYTYELIEIVPISDEKMKNEFGEANPILVFNEEFIDMNTMKASAFKFVNLIIQFSTMYSLTNNHNSTNDLDDKIYIINNQLLIDITSKLITLSIKSFENILNDGKKFYYLRNIDEERNDEENKFNLLLYEIIAFLCESLTKEPIKAEFDQHIKLFLLNILFPFLTTVESEKRYMRDEPDEYCAYFNDLVYNFTLKNFRIAGIFLIKKISEEYIDISNFILSYIIGMLSDILNKNTNGANADYQGNNINIIDSINNAQGNQFNAYYFYKANNVLFDKLNDETKLDFCLLILIVLQKQLLEYNALKNKLKDALINAKDILMNIKGVLIKIKFCHLFKSIIPYLFTDENDDNKSTSDDQNDNDKDNENDMNKIIETDTNTSLKYENFIEIALNFLFNNLIQLKSEDYLIYETYYHALGNEASICIISLFEFIQNENDNKNDLIKNKLIDLLQTYFHKLIDLINVINLYSFFNVIEQIIKYIMILNRKDLFDCLDKLTKRFDKEFDTGDINSQTYCPLYFQIISSFLTGVNKIKANNKTEIKLFNNIFQLALDQMNDVSRFIYYEKLVESMIDYIKCFKGIDKQSSFVLKSVIHIIDNDRGFSLNSYNYVKTFLFYLDNNICDGFLNQELLFDKIIDIIKKAFTFEDDQYDSSNLYALLLILQIFTKNLNISDKIHKLLLAYTMKCFSYIFEKDEKNGSAKRKKIKNMVIFGILASGYIFFPEKTNSILSELDIIEKKEKKGIYEEIQYEKFNFNTYINILEYINEYEIENELLRKCLILGFCSIFRSDALNMFLNNNKDIKIKLIKIFAEFILYHKDEEIKKRYKLMQNDLKIKKNENGKINYEEESESEEEEPDKENDIFDKNLNFIFEANDNIIKSDEYQYFKDTLDSIKNNDNECINKLSNYISQEKIKQLEDIYHVKKLKVNYQGKELQIARRIVNIKRANN